MLFFAHKVVSEGLTFRIAMLISLNSEVLAHGLNHTTWFSKKIRLNSLYANQAINKLANPTMQAQMSINYCFR